MSEMSCDEYTLRTKQTSKKSWGEEEGGKLTTKTLIIIINFSQMYLWIHYKYSSTSFKQRLPEEFHGNSTLSIITFPPLSVNVIGFGSVAHASGRGADLPCRWSRFDSRLSCFFLCCILLFFVLLLFLFLIILSPLDCFPLFLLLAPYSFARVVGPTYF